MFKILIAQYQSQSHHFSRQHSVYSILQLTSCPTLTKKFSQLTSTKAPLLRGSLKFYLFNEKTRFVSSLKKTAVYCWFYVKKGSYYQIQDWKLLGDKMTVSRSWGCLVKQKITNEN